MGVLIAAVIYLVFFHHGPRGADGITATLTGARAPAADHMFTAASKRAAAAQNLRYQHVFERCTLLVHNTAATVQPHCVTSRLRRRMLVQRHTEREGDLDAWACILLAHNSSCTEINTQAQDVIHRFHMAKRYVKRMKEVGKNELFTMTTCPEKYSIGSRTTPGQVGTCHRLRLKRTRREGA